ncbi:MAG: hypothetical protein Fur0039_26470 [Rhodocyclaceae bacterium]
MARGWARRAAGRIAADWPLAQADWLWLASSLAGLLGVVADGGLLARQYPPPHDLASLIRALRALGLSTRWRPLQGARLRTPCIAFLRSPAAPEAAGEKQGGGGEAVLVPVLVLRSDGERLLYFRPGSRLAETARLGEPGAGFEAEVLAIGAPAAAARGEGAGLEPSAGGSPFGLRWFLAELSRQRAVLRDVLIAAAALQAAGLAVPLLTQLVIDKVIAHHSLSTLAVLAAGYGLVIAFSAVMGWLRQYLLIHTGMRVDAVLSARVFAHLTRLPLAYFERRPTGTLVARLNAVETIREFLCGALLLALLDVPFMGLALAVMLFYSWKLTLIAAALVLSIAALGLALTPRLRARINEQFLCGARNQAYVTEHVGAMETVKCLQMEPGIERRYGDYLAAYLGAALRTRTLANGYGVTTQALEQAQSAAVLAAGALLVMEEGGFTVGMLVAFQMFAVRLTQPVLRLAGMYPQFQEAGIAVRRLADIMDAPEEPVALAASRARPAGAAAVTLESVGFRYGSERPWLFRDLSLAIAPGRTVALMGPSGCGKSTLARLLLGLVQPVEGRILIDGIDLRSLAANEIRAHFGVVPQETVLFSGTILENVAAGEPGAGFEDVVRACRAAGIHEAIEQLPQGYRSAIGERGVGLSGGQKQRLAIARALLRRPRILIFDEATASLDAQTAEAFARTINELKGQVTMLFIAHQLPKGLEVDEVVRMGT